MTATTTRDIVLRMEGTVLSMKEMVEKLDHTINGNGTPGLKTDMQSIGNRVEKLEKRNCDEDIKVERRSNRGWDLRKGMLLLVLGQVVTLIGLFISFRLGLK